MTVSLIVSFLIMLVVVFVIAALIVFILSRVPGVPAFFQSIVWAIAGIIVLIWIVQHVLPLAGVH